MTPRETELMNALIRATVEDAVRQAVTPLQAEIATLRGVDRRHSIAVRQSKSEIHEKVDDTVDALARRDYQLVAAIQEVRDEVAAARAESKKSLAPAATAAVDAATEARNAGIDLKLVKKDTARAVVWYRSPALAAILTAVVTALLNWFAHVPPAGAH